MTYNGKAKIENTLNRLKIIIPSKKNLFALLFGTIWMLGWFIAFVSVLSIILFSTESGDIGINGFSLIWLTGWTIGGIVIATLLLWGYFGQEKFIIAHNEVLFNKTVFGFGKKKILDISKIKNFRAEFINDNWCWYRSNRWSVWGLGAGKIKFDYGYKTYSFGLGVDDAEANHIVEILNEKIG